MAKAIAAVPGGKVAIFGSAAVIGLGSATAGTLAGAQYTPGHHPATAPTPTTSASGGRADAGAAAAVPVAATLPATPHQTTARRAVRRRPAARHHATGPAPRHPALAGRPVTTAAPHPYTPPTPAYRPPVSTPSTSSTSSGSAGSSGSAPAGGGLSLGH